MKSDELFKLFNILITSFIAAGGLGFINFAILEKLDVIRQERDKNDEKILFILFFSIINYTIFLFLFSFPQEELTVREYIFLLASNITITLLLSIVMSLVIFPIAAKMLKELVNFVRTIMKKPLGSNQTPKEELFSKSDMFTFVYIFDFDRNKIGEGYLEGWLNDTEKLNQVSLSAPGELENLNYQQVEQRFNDCRKDPEPDTTRHLIDFDNKVHYFIFYQKS